VLSGGACNLKVGTLPCDALEALHALVRSVLVQDYRCSGGWAQKRVFAISTMDMRVA
jgi:hypothetical protein